MQCNLAPCPSEGQIRHLPKVLLPRQTNSLPSWFPDRAGRPPDHRRQVGTSRAGPGRQGTRGLVKRPNRGKLVEPRGAPPVYHPAKQRRGGSRWPVSSRGPRPPTTAASRAHRPARPQPRPPPAETAARRHGVLRSQPPAGRLGRPPPVPARSRWCTRHSATDLTRLRADPGQTLHWGS